MSRFLDCLGMVSAFISAWLWLRASSYLMRRIQKTETFDTLDLNRMIIAMNRSQILNRRAALATAFSAFVLALKFGYDLFNPA